MRESEVSISVVKCSWVKCGEVQRSVAELWCSFGFLIFLSLCVWLYVLYTFV